MDPNEPVWIVTGDIGAMGSNHIGEPLHFPEEIRD
jgi:hypothetical protein